MATITKKELIERISNKCAVKRSVGKKVVQLFLEEMIQELKKGNRLEFRDFGVFEVKERAARQAQNPKTLERVLVPAKRTVKFKIGRLMRESVEVYGSSPNGTLNGSLGVNGAAIVEAKPERAKATV